MFSHLDAELALVRTRRSAAKRDAIISGALLGLAGTSLLVLGLLGTPQGFGRSLTIIGFTAIAFLISHAQAYARWAAATASIQLIEAMQRDEQRARLPD
jgi:hypothetical protein